MRVVISSGHGKYVPGASGYIEEHPEAVRVVNEVAQVLMDRGAIVRVFHDDVSRTQNENLHRIVDFHNNETRDLDVSVHFNSNGMTPNPLGSEVLYVSTAGSHVAKAVVDSICDSVPFINRGITKRNDLYFLNNTEMPAILIETCFVTSKADTDIYHAQFEDLCRGIAAGILGEDIAPGPIPPDAGVLFHAQGKCSWFGGPNDTGVASDEGLAFYSSIGQAPQLFLPSQPVGTTGLARRLNPYVHYVACRWDYNRTPAEMLRSGVALVRANGMELQAFPADWGPNENTGRVADLSPSLMTDLRLETDDEVEIVFPFSAPAV